jgi:hypothetical protein
MFGEFSVSYSRTLAVVSRAFARSFGVTVPPPSNLYSLRIVLWSQMYLVLVGLDFKGATRLFALPLSEAEVLPRSLFLIVVYDVDRTLAFGARGPAVFITQTL